MDPLMKDLTGRAKRIAGAVTGNESLEELGHCSHWPPPSCQDSFLAL